MSVCENMHKIKKIKTCDAIKTKNWKLKKTQVQYKINIKRKGNIWICWHVYPALMVFKTVIYTEPSLLYNNTTDIIITLPECNQIKHSDILKTKKTCDHVIYFKLCW